jgi:predicted DNA binding CopG/RHH family protein
MNIQLADHEMEMVREAAEYAGLPIARFLRAVVISECQSILDGDDEEGTS